MAMMTVFSNRKEEEESKEFINKFEARVVSKMFHGLTMKTVQ